MMNIVQKWLTPNPYSRPQTKLKGVKGIVVHWWAVANGSINGVWNFYENRKHGKSGYGSAHFIVGLNGEIVQCIPENELSYAVGAKKYYTNKLGSYPNNCTLHIEMAHVDMKGNMTKETWDASVKLTAHLLKKYKLTVNDIYRHYDITRKDCPKLFVDNPKEFERFKQDVQKELNKDIAVKNTAKNVQQVQHKKQQKLQEVFSMKMSDFVSNHNMKQLEEVYKKAHEEGLLNDNTWAEKAANKTITVGEVAFLATILNDRKFNKYLKSRE